MAGEWVYVGDGLANNVDGDVYLNCVVQVVQPHGVIRKKTVTIFKKVSSAAPHPPHNGLSAQGSIDSCSSPTSIAPPTAPLGYSPEQILTMISSVSALPPTTSHPYHSLTSNATIPQPHTLTPPRPHMPKPPSPHSLHTSH